MLTCGDQLTWEPVDLGDQLTVGRGADLDWREHHHHLHDHHIIIQTKPVQWGLLAAGSWESSEECRNSPRRSVGETGNDGNDDDDDPADEDGDDGEVMMV